MESPQASTPNHPGALTANQRNSRRLSQFTTLLRERWPEYVLEVIVIIVSITLSLAVDEPSCSS